MIERLQISNLRNLTQVNMHTAACNVMIGANGSGKTSLLEAIFLLSRGKSFRHHQPKRYIQHHQHTATVHARLSDGNTLAIQKQADAATLLRLNQSTVYNQSILTEQLPTLLIDPSSMDMLEQGSASRRQLLDWLVFHMKQGFHPQWLAYQRLLRQRNSLLKKSKHLTHVQLAELRSWDKGLGNHAALIHHYRQHVFTKWQPYFADSIAQLLPSYAEQLSLSYHAGYDTDVALEVQLGERLEQDLQLGYTRIGNHRADIHVHWRSNDTVATNDTMPPDKLPAGSGSKQVIADPLPMLKEQAANVLSRGEKKLLITALRLSQLPLLLRTASTTQASTNENERVLTATPVVLLDDITAELDERAIEILLSTLAKLPCQVFMSSLTADITPMVNGLWSNPTMFHVKQGQVLPF
ncbi:MAG: DNA replication/repair protein RecF [Psychrobacter celer]|uniref:DNA replication/repair protein RecF n=1 Tax=Psychrobacter celer TaxID=306572 RepID=UPI003FB66D39